MKRKQGLLEYISFLDILFSTMGMLILISSINFFLIESNLNSLNDTIYSRNEILEIKEQKRELGDLYWLKPIYVAIFNDKFIIYDKSLNRKRNFYTQDDVLSYIREISVKNCINKRENREDRFSILFLITKEGYIRYNSLSIAIELINEDNIKKYNENYFPLKEGKSLILERDIENYFNNLK